MSLHNYDQTANVIVLDFPRGSRLTKTTIDEELAKLKTRTHGDSETQSVASHYILGFDSVKEFHPDATPSIRKFARELGIRGIQVTDANAAIARRILTTMGAFFNLQRIVIVNSMPNEEAITMPLVLRRTTTSLLELHLIQMKLTTDVLREWVSLASGLKESPLMKKLVVRNVKFEKNEACRGRAKLASSSSLKTFCDVLDRFVGLEHFEFEPAQDTSYHSNVSFDHLGVSLSKMKRLKKLTIVDVNMESSDNGLEAFFGPRSNLSKSLVELTLLSCGLTRSTIRMMFVISSPFGQLKMLDLSDNFLLTKRDAKDLNEIYANFVSASLDDSDESSDETDVSSEDLLCWDSTQRDF